MRVVLAERLLVFEEVIEQFTHACGRSRTGSARVGEAAQIALVATSRGVLEQAAGMVLPKQP